MRLKSRSGKTVDLDRMVVAAVDSYLRPEETSNHRPRRKDRRLGGVPAVGLGVVIGLAARKAYDRARALDLETVAGALEKRLKQ
jgi:hypothetical protein